MLGYYLSLDQKILFNGNFSSSHKITGTCYTDNTQSVAFDLTNYTLTLRFYKDNNSSDYLNATASITTAASGTWNLAVTSGTLPSSGFYLVDLVLTKSGIQISNLNRVEVLIKRGPTD